jgi:hypothetical protein
MAVFARSFALDRTGNRPDRFARSLPAQLVTFEEFQASRMDRLNHVTDDIRAKRCQEINDLQIKLQDLLMRLSAARSALAEDERDFLNKREALVTELQKVKIDADIKFSQAQVDHMNEKERLQRHQDSALVELTKSVEISIEPKQFQANPDILKAQIRLRQFEAGLKKLRDSALDRSLNADPDLDDSQDLYVDRISKLERQKSDLIQAIADDEQSSESRITELTLMLDSQENSFANEIGAIQKKIKRKEEQYKMQIEKLYSDLERIQLQRQVNMEKRRTKVQELQDQIQNVETEFQDKLKDASRVSEKLKAALVTANLKKNQELEIERQRSSEQRQLMQKSMTLKQQLFLLQKELKRVTEESLLLRRELSGKIGPRRAASVFL